MWMQNFGGPCPKPTMLVGNTRAIAALKDEQLKWGNRKVIKTCVKYTDGKGKVRYKGTDQLRSTQSFCSILCFGSLFWDFLEVLGVLFIIYVGCQSF